MAKKANVELRVGVITLLALVILLGSLYWLKGYKVQHGATRVKVVFADVGSLAEGDRVTVSGVDMGKVDDLKLTGNGVLINLLLYPGVNLRRNAQFTIRNQGVMGERYIAIQPGDAPEPFDTSMVAVGRSEIGVAEIVGTAGDIANQLREMVGAIRKTVASDTSLARFNEAVRNFEDLSRRLASIISANQDRLNQTSTHFLAASTQLDDMLHRNSYKVDSTFDRFQAVASSMDTLVGQLDSLSRSVRSFADNLQNGDGTLQLLVNDRRLYDDLRGTADNLDNLISDIKANPRKYINLKIGIF